MGNRWGQDMAGILLHQQLIQFLIAHTVLRQLNIVVGNKAENTSGVLQNMPKTLFQHTV